ncbi:hypothetical protein P7K49_000616 [Saguinus oedipus]|uniref:Uncharacterized protein n=1 Tax=Saguinus oedipus TaxID=9490 RepID=A0ABQ9WCL6_SAGOE|nr:hypothetical protein P7K49_000616 [Saguinus oedipus]
MEHATAPTHPHLSAFTSAQETCVPGSLTEGQDGKTAEDLARSEQHEHVAGLLARLRKRNDRQRTSQSKRSTSPDLQPLALLDCTAWVPALGTESHVHRLVYINYPCSIH